MIQYAASVALNYEENKCNQERFSNSKLFINKYKWKRIKYLIGKNKYRLIKQKTKKDWETFGKNNPVIALNNLFKIKRNMSSLYLKKLIGIVKNK